jgi:hypothetical protein
MLADLLGHPLDTVAELVFIQQDFHGDFPVLISGADGSRSVVDRLIRFRCGNRVFFTFRDSNSF